MWFSTLLLKGMLWIYASQTRRRSAYLTQLLITSFTRHKIERMWTKMQKTLHHHSRTWHSPRLHPIPNKTQTWSLSQRSNHLALLSSSSFRRSPNLTRLWIQWILGYLRKTILKRNHGICLAKCGQTIPSHSRSPLSTGCYAPRRFAATCSRD